MQTDNHHAYYKTNYCHHRSRWKYGLRHCEKYCGRQRKTYTLDEIADLLSEASGMEIAYTDISVFEFKDTLEEIGLPEEQIAMSVTTAQTFVNGALDFTFDDMEQLLGRRPTGLDTFIK